MFVSYRITACVIGLFTGAVIFRLVRRNLLHGSYAAWWLAAGLFAVLVGVFPSGFDRLGHALGVNYPPILFIVLALAAFAVRMLISDMERTRMELTQRRLVQRYAHMSLRLRAIERELLAHGMSLPRHCRDTADDAPVDDAPGPDGQAGPPSS